MTAPHGSPSIILRLHYPISILSSGPSEVVLTQKSKTTPKLSMPETVKPADQPSSKPSHQDEKPPKHYWIIKIRASNCIKFVHTQKKRRFRRFFLQRLIQILLHVAKIQLAEISTEGIIVHILDSNTKRLFNAAF